MSAIVMYQLNDAPSSIAPTATAGVRSGDNGYPGGAPEVTLGTTGATPSFAHVEWDDDVSDGFDSGPVAFTFDFGASASSASGAAYPGAISAGGLGGAISAVDLRACVQSSDCEAKFSGITLTFKKNGVVTDVVSVDDLDAQTAGDGDAQEDMASVTPAAADNDEVIVTGTVRLTCSDAYYIPDVNELFCQALICT